MINPDNLNLMRKIWNDVDEQDYSSVRAAHLHEIERILNLAREEGRAEVRSGRAVVRISSRR